MARLARVTIPNLQIPGPASKLYDVLNSNLTIKKPPTLP